ncbi:DUF58 domain-containing protein [Nocardioides faecalis]|uniref:DUF58 domain-containing protein n=1 Tax=Nocardioides faecalis TaxID=2803858 RepID=UPI001BD14DCF|nr:DUF58 domain-containing protein [Nocardioides faecalis]QVI57593.1 DUF58 domain-containing protein [Nocardioides faecalis]
MRRPFSPLTLRGRTFLAAGLTAIACAVVLGQPALSRVGVLVASLPLLALLLARRRVPDLQVSRDVQPRTLRAGESARIGLTIAAGSGRAPGALLVEDGVPYALGDRPRLVLQGLGQRWERSVDYPVRADLRGQYAVGPLVVRMGDPFGLVERRRAVPGVATLVVTPRVVPLSAIPAAGGWQGTGEHRAQAFAAGSTEDASVREYRRGDDLRRVHWRSSARVGELMVRREEEPWEAHAHVLLDNRAHVHRGQGAGSSLETAVVAAASVITHLASQGYSVRLSTAEGTVALNAEEALQRLAVLQLVPHALLQPAHRGDAPRGGVVVAILGQLADADAPALRRLRHEAAAALAMVLDVAQWSATGRSDGAAAAAAPLLVAGWRAVGLGPRDRLDAVWRDLGRTAVRAAAAAPRQAAGQ